jgi:Putative MetA-pathway of phenol degradation
MDRQFPRQSGLRSILLLSTGFVFASGPPSWAEDTKLGTPGALLPENQIRHDGDPDLNIGAESTVEVRVGYHRDFERLVFEWPTVVDCDVVQNAQEVTLAFSQPGRIDVSGISNRLRRVVDARVESDDATARVILRVLPNARVRSLNLQDGRVAIDVYGGAGAQDLAPPASNPESETIQELKRALEQRDAVIEQRDAAIEQLRSQLDQLVDRFDRLERTVALSSGDLDRVTAGRGAPTASVGSMPRPEPRAPSAAPYGAPVGQSSLETAVSRSPATPEQQTAATNQAPGSESTGAPASQETAQSQAPAPGQVEVDEEAAERALEVTLVQQGALLLPFGSAQFTPSFTYTRQTGDFPVISNGLIAEREVRRNEFDFFASLLVGLPFDSQLELGLPYNLVEQKIVDNVGGAARDESSNTGHGLGDFSVGLAKTLLRERNWLPDVILRADWDTGTGESQDNDVVLGGGFQELTGSISLTKRQDPLVFVAGASYGATFEHNDIDPGDTLGFAIGTFLAASPDTSLRVVLNQSFIDEFEIDGQKIDGSDLVQSVLTFGASAILGRNMLVDAAVGVGLTDDSPDYSVSLSLPIRFSTPGF